MGSLSFVYVIDDDHAVLESTQFLLGSRDIDSAAFEDPLDFLRQAGELEPGCVLTDLNMPAMNGIELRRSLLARGIDWPVVLMSARSNRKPALDLLDLQFLDFIDKPFTPARLFDVLERAFEELARRGTGAAAASGC